MQPKNHIQRASWATKLITDKLSLFFAEFSQLNKLRFVFPCRANAGAGSTAPLLLHLPGPVHHVVQGPGVEEGGLRVVVHLPVQNGPEAPQGLAQGHIDPRHAGELLRHMGGLGEEALELPRPVHGALIRLAELVHAQNGDDVLELPVLLQDRLHPRAMR